MTEFRFPETIPYKYIDEEIRCLVYLMNQIPFIETFFCCACHEATRDSRSGYFQAEAYIEFKTSDENELLKLIDRLIWLNMTHVELRKGTTEWLTVRKFFYIRFKEWGVENAYRIGVIGKEYGKDDIARGYAMVAKRKGIEALEKFFETLIKSGEYAEW